MASTKSNSSTHTMTKTKAHNKNPLTKAWHVLTTGWVLEYPDSRNGPKDFFDRKPGVNGGHPDYYLKSEKKKSRWGAADGEAETLGEEEGREDGCLRWCEEVKKQREMDEKI